jgi:hypothetical protein
VARQAQRAGGCDVEIRLPKYPASATCSYPTSYCRCWRSSSRPVSQNRGCDPARETYRRTQVSVGNGWRQACRDAGVSAVPLDDLRHYFASGLIAPGCDVVTVQRAMGHRKATTIDTYSHLWPTAEDKLRAGAASMVAEVSESCGPCGDDTAVTPLLRASLRRTTR